MDVALSEAEKGSDHRPESVSLPSAVGDEKTLHKGRLHNFEKHKNYIS